jgi:hypothetical protein
MRAHLARLRFELAEALLARASSGDQERARILLEDARELARELNQRALVRFIDERMTDVGVIPSHVKRADSTAAPAATIALVREGDFWSIAFGTRSTKLRDSRGLRVLDRLLASPGQEFHVLQLISPGNDESTHGDAGTALDSEAIQSYKNHLLELREELEEAEGFADAGRIDRATSQIDFLTQELARAVGLGGRERRVGNAAERARTTAQKRLREAIRRIDAEMPELGRHLEQTIRTGTFCGYFPNGRPRQGRS